MKNTVKKLVCKLVGHAYFTDGILDYFRNMAADTHRYCSRCGHHEPL